MELEEPGGCSSLLHRVACIDAPLMLLLVECMQPSLGLYFKHPLERKTGTKKCRAESCHSTFHRA